MADRMLRRVLGDKPVMGDDFNRWADTFLGNSPGRIKLWGDGGNVLDLHTGAVVSSNNFSIAARSDVGYHGQFRHSADTHDVLNVLDAGLTAIGTLGVTGATTITGAFGVTGATTLTGALTVTGAVILGDNIADTVVIAGTLGVTGLTTLTSLTATGPAVILGDANSDTLVVIAVATFKNVAGDVQLFTDPSNNQTIVGRATPIGGSNIANSLQVVGKAYLGPTTAAEDALHIRRSAAATVGWTVGVENSPVNLAFKDDSGTKMFALGDAAHTYQAMVTGHAHVSGDTFAGTRLAVGAVAFSGTEELRVVGQTRLEGLVTITSGGLTVTGLGTFNSGLAVIGDVGFYGSAPAGQGAVGGASSDLATVITLANNIRAVMRNIGLSS